jgi:hypothetical protein
MKSSVYCLVRTQDQANRIVKDLHDAGFTEQNISVLFPDQETSRDFAHDKRTQAPAGINFGAGTGGILGGALGWIVGMGSLGIPGVGPFIAAGPILAALSGAAVGAAVGGIAGGLIGLGIPEFQANLYEGKIRSGHILLLVHVDKKLEIDAVKRFYRNAGAEDISSANEALVVA